MGRGRSRGQSAAMLGLGLVFLILGSWSGAQYRHMTLFSPFFFEPSGLAVSPDGEVLVGVQDSRIHIYSDEGMFLRGWGVAPDEGLIRMRTLSDRGLEVARQKEGVVSLYDYRGELLESREDPAAFEALGPDQDLRVTGPSGDVFELGPRGLSRVSEGASQRIVPLPAWPLSLFGRAPMIPVALTMTVGAVLILVGVIMTADISRGGE
ncbi:MAG: hypothetical protein CMN75_16715 [Spirochaeta sp.]|nr:hypothetical protein [Spirochaeta sp.]RPG08606.1 MAG: hypothetical protein CBC32_007955 [Proteobacteria bacterium TMED72]